MPDVICLKLYSGISSKPSWDKMEKYGMKLGKWLRIEKSSQASLVQRTSIIIIIMKDMQTLQTELYY